MDSIEPIFTEALRIAVDRYLNRQGHQDSGIPQSSAPLRGADKIWITAEEATVYLGLRSRMALYQAVRRGQVPAHRLGRRLRFRLSDLHDAIARG